MGESRPQLIETSLQRVIISYFIPKILLTGAGHEILEVINDLEETIPPIVRAQLDLSPLIESIYLFIPERLYPGTVVDRV